MERIYYTHEKMEKVKEQVQKMISIVKELENDFPGRHFTLDDHLVGSIGEVMAAYYYGIELYTASAEIHDGIVDAKEVQIKFSQQDSIAISHEPEYLIVLYLRKNGEIYEVYNGSGKAPWEFASKSDKRKNRHMRVNKLMELDMVFPSDQRIKQVQEVTKMKKCYKN